VRTLAGSRETSIAATHHRAGGNPGFTTADGPTALKNLTSGIGNSAFGWYCLFSDTTASYNTGLGAEFRTLNTGGGEYCRRRRRAHREHGRDENTANGAGAMVFNTTGNDNAGVGIFNTV